MKVCIILMSLWSLSAFSQAYLSKSFLESQKQKAKQAEGQKKEELTAEEEAQCEIKTEGESLVQKMQQKPIPSYLVLKPAPENKPQVKMPEQPDSFTDEKGITYYKGKDGIYRQKPIAQPVQQPKIQQIPTQQFSSNPVQRHIQEINLARTNPKAYANLVEQDLNSGRIFGDRRDYVATIRYLREQARPMGALQVDRNLMTGAQNWARYSGIGHDRNRGNCAENVAGIRDPRGAMVQLIGEHTNLLNSKNRRGQIISINDGHRRNIMNPRYRYVGVGIGGKLVQRFR